MTSKFAPLTAGLIIDGRRISDADDPYVVAEIGHNHGGSLDTCMQLFLAAKRAGADAVKLQKRDNRTLYTRAVYDAPYLSENAYGPTYGAHREALEFGRAEYIELRQYAESLGLTFFATAFDMPSADFLAGLDVPAFKIASGDLTNTPLLEYIAKLDRPIILSTGGGSFTDVLRAYETIMAHNQQLAILQCTAAYPVEPRDMNLAVIPRFRSAFPGAVFGLSDHQNGIAMSLVAYALGARIFEKHFTLNRAWRGTDHAFSLEPAGLGKMVRDLRRARLSLGDGCKRRLACEEPALRKMGKSLVATASFDAGHVLKPEDIAAKSPNGGLPPYELANLIGKRLKKGVSSDYPFESHDVELIL